MQKDELRLECLKLVYRRDRSPEDNLRDARIFEEFLVQESTESSDKKSETPQKRGRPPKKFVGNSDLFD